MNILVVEDDPDLAGLVQLRLEADGHTVMVAHDGEAGRDALNPEIHDVVILDWTLPGITGIELCTHIRATPDLKHLPVILITARAQQADIDEGFAAGVDEYMVKPFSPRELAGLVNSFEPRCIRDRND